MSTGWDGPPVDLAAEPPDAALLARGLAAGQWRRWVPWRAADGRLWVASSEEPTPALAAEVAVRHPGLAPAFRPAGEAELEAAVHTGLRAALLFESAERFAFDHPGYSAKPGLVRWQRLTPLAGLVALLLGLLANWWWTLIVVLVLANLTFSINATFKVAATLFRPLSMLQHRRIARAEAAELAELGLDPGDLLARGDELPLYTILVPVYQEANVIAQILANLEHLRYPRSRLDIIVLFEEVDTETIDAARAAAPPPHIRLMVVPDGEPRTKPRACNYGLLFAKGEYVVIYDAEDRPEPDQLLKALACFRHDDVKRRVGGSRPLACVQAALNYYNADYNVLTRMFAIEYAHWFDSMLPGMDAAGVPIPLGGTSNHFLRSVLV